MNRVVVRTKVDLLALYPAVDLDEIELHTAQYKFRGLIPLALKRAFFALRPGGILTIVDNSRISTDGEPYQIPFNLMRQWVFRLLGSGVSVLDFDERRSFLRLQRRASIAPPGWSAGVVFSGSDAEIPQLMVCLKGLLAQPQLHPEEGGEILVCGPSRDTAFLNAFPQVRYVVYDPAPSPRFMICAKKNFLIDQLRGPRVIVIHCRIVLQPGALARIPREFEIGTPEVFVEEKGALRPYLSLAYNDGYLPGQFPRRYPRSLRNVRNADMFSVYRQGACYIDGGTMCVMKSVYADCALDPNLAWSEGEDYEWCMRASASGYLVELFPGATAHSQSFKLKSYPMLPVVLRAPASTVVAFLRLVKHRLLHGAAVLAGRR